MSRALRFAAALSALALLAGALATPAQAQMQRQSIVGSVTDEQGNPLKGVEIRLHGTESKAPDLNVKSNKKGRFNFALVQADVDYEFEVAFEGYAVSNLQLRGVDDKKQPNLEFDGAVRPGDPLPNLRVTPNGKLEVTLVLAPARQIEEAFLSSQIGPIVERLESGDLEGGLAALEALLAEHPDEANLHYLRGYALIRLQRVDEAVEPLQRAVELDDSMVGLHAALAAALAETGRLEEAQEHYRLEAEGAGGLDVRVDALVGLADVARARDQNEAALGALEEALGLAPERSDLYARLADVYTRLGQPEKADEALATAETLGGEDPVAEYNLAAKYMNEGQYEKAVAHFRKAEALDPSLAQCRYHVGIALINLNRPQEARAELEAFVQKAPDAPEAENARQILEMLSEDSAP
jgi:tetratricopeptide (TPR) repeat protein